MEAHLKLVTLERVAVDARSSNEVERDAVKERVEDGRGQFNVAKVTRASEDVELAGSTTE